MFEHHKEQLASRKAFVSRQVKYLFFSLVILSLSIGIGIVGYHIFGRLSWIDSFLNASMILTGMGPADHLDTTGGNSLPHFTPFSAASPFLPLSAFSLRLSITAFCTNFTLIIKKKIGRS